MLVKDCHCSAMVSSNACTVRIKADLAPDFKGASQPRSRYASAARFAVRGAVGCRHRARALAPKGQPVLHLITSSVGPAARFLTPDNELRHGSPYKALQASCWCS